MKSSFCFFYTKSFAFWVLFFVLTQSAFAQISPSSGFQIIDNEKKTPLGNATVRISFLNSSLKQKDLVLFADKNGFVEQSFTEPCVVNISYIGYQKLSDTFRYNFPTVFTMQRMSNQLEDLVVTAQYQTSGMKSSVYGVQVLTDADFKKKGANNLREALMGEMNIDLSQDNVTGSGLSIQGISGEGVKIMIDGVPMVGRIDGKLDINQITLSNIQRVEIVKGPLSVLYGTDAMGGVINLITKTNQAENFQVNLKGYYETVGQYNVDANVGLNIGRSQFYVSGGRIFFDGFSQYDTSRHKDWRPKEQYFADAKYIFTHPKVRVTLMGSFFREYMIDRGNLRPYTTYAFDQHFKTIRPLGSVAFLFPLKDLAQLDLLVSYSGFWRYYNSYKKDLTTLNETIVPSETQDSTVYHHINARLVYTLNTKNRKVSVQGGLDVNHEQSIQNRMVGGHQQIGDYAAFVSARWKPSPKVDIQPAVRFSYNTKFRVPLLPSLNIKWDIDKYATLRLGYGYSFRAPGLKELYLEFKDSNHNLKGNESLKPEKGHSGNISLEINGQVKDHKLRATFTHYVNYITDKIDFAITDAVSTPVTYQYFNLNQLFIAGEEYKLDYRFKRLSTTAGISLNFILVKNINSADPDKKFFSPDFFATINYKIPKAEIGINVLYKYTGKKLLYTLNTSYQSGTRNAYHGLDVVLSRTFWKERIQLSLGGKNLIGVTNVLAQSVNAVGHNFDANSATVGWGRTFFISLIFHYSHNLK